jgi:class 3 adenylate cyclase/predicted ATPase
VDIAAWLRELGLEQYERAFLDQDIDADVLPQLTADDLIAVGVASVGHRRKLLSAIAALNQSEPSARDAPTPPTAPAPDRRLEAERRQLTVLFCDLVGSTALSARLDPEDMSAVMRAYQESCAEVVRRWEGHVAKYMGDGVLAYFGWPQAHEDDAERAVRAGLELAAAVGRLKPGDDTPLAARVGIATGLVMVGELIGEGAAQEEAVVGDTPNLAARLQALAEPGAVVLAASTRHLLGGLFELTDLAPMRLKGFAEPLAAFRVEGEGRAEGRFEALHGQRLTPLVGREQELAILLERWAWAKDSDGQVVLLAGEPGIGKSRLLRALRQELSGEPHVALSHFCSPYHTNSALYPIIAQLERAAEFAPDDVPEAKLAKLEALLRQATDQLGEALPLIGNLLGIPSSERYPALNLSPQRQKQRTLEVLIEQLAGLARDRPVLELYEDVHWVDPSTLELLDLLVQRVRDLPILAVLTYRPEFNPPWSGHTHVTSLPLNRLGRRQGAAMVERITGGKALPNEILDQIVARTDGVPLFVEELTKTVLESGLLVDAGYRYELAGPLPPLAIPATLQDSLMARLDRLAPVKEVAQTAAVIGREFSHDLLAAVSPLSQTNLGAALDQLVASELIFRRGTPPAVTYSFKHALVQDAAYQSLLKSKRQPLHARIGQALEKELPEGAAAEPEILAHHFTEAGLYEKAAERWHAAGQQAAQRSAYREAVEHLHKSLEVLRLAGDEDWCVRQEIRVQNALGVVLSAARGFVPEVLEAHERARELCRGVVDPEQLSRAIYGVWLFTQRQGKFKPSIGLARELLAMVEQEQDSGLVLEAHHAMWTTGWHCGELATGRLHAEFGLQLYRADQHHHLAGAYGGHDAGVCCRYASAMIALLQGYPDRAVRWGQESLKLARELRHPFSHTLALEFIPFVHEFRREPVSVEEHVRALIEISTEQRFPLRTAGGQLHQGWLLLARGDAEEAIAQIGRGLAASQALGSQMRHSYFLALLAKAYLHAGRHDQSVSTIDQALGFIRESGERWWEAEVHRLHGELLLARRARDRADAEECFHRALRLAREQTARSLELRAAMSLARVWAEHGRRAEGHDLLAPVYGWFTEGFDTADLKDAKALLDELA